METAIKENVRVNTEIEHQNFGIDVDMRGHSRGTWREWHQYPGDLYHQADGSYRFSIRTLIEVSTPTFNMQFGDVKLEADTFNQKISELTEIIKKQQQTIDDLKMELKRGAINIQDRLDFNGRVDIDNLYVNGRSMNDFFYGYGYGYSIHNTTSYLSRDDRLLDDAVKKLSEAVVALAEGGTVNPTIVEKLMQIKDDGAIQNGELSQ